MIKIRDVAIDDYPFIYSSWLKSVRKDFSSLESDQYFQLYKQHINAVMDNSHIIVASDQDDPKFIMGYLVYSRLGEIPIFHWAFVKHTFRKFAIFSKLVKHVVSDFPNSPIVVTYERPRVKSGKFRFVYKPELRMRGRDENPIHATSTSSSG